jgi:hypothetical protein
MPKSKGARQTKSAPKAPKREPLVIEVQFTGKDPGPPGFLGETPAAPTAKKSDRPARPGVTFRF